MVMNKRGWIKVFEAVAAIMLVTSIVLVLYSKQSKSEDISGYVYGLQAKVLSDIALKPELREAVFENESEKLENFTSEKIPRNLNFEIKICALDPSDHCKMSTYTEKDVYANDVILSSNIITYNPKKVRLFIWEK